MDMEHHFHCVPIPINEGRIRNMTFDGCHYYFLLHNEIVKTDMNFEILCEYQINREYNHICYDWKDKCFWAASPVHQNILYQLDCTMCEIGSVTLKGISIDAGNITGLSYECCCDKIMISFENSIVRMQKNGDCKRCFFMPNACIVGIASICPGCIITMIKENKLCFYIWPPRGCIQELYCIEQDIEIRNLFFNPCCQGKERIDYLVFPHGKAPMLCQMPLNEQTLGYQPWKCNFEICQNGCKPPVPPEPPKPVNCNCILESIALEEAALAHILNAEGEKIQKIVAITDDFDKIMKVNQEVNDTIIHVTMLEQTLYAKLLAVSKICPFEHDEPCLNDEK